MPEVKNYPIIVSHETRVAGEPGRMVALDPLDETS